MQVILLHDVAQVGHEGDVLKVADGYGRNFLIPQGLAVTANKGTLKDLENRRGAIEKREADKREAAQQIADSLKDRTITVTAHAGQGTRLHGTITATQIAEAASAQLETALDRRDIEILEPIRELGSYLISARIYKGVHVQLPVVVVSDKASDNEAEEAVTAQEAPAEETATAEETADEAKEASEEA